jgi:3-oxoacyl-(acyl-carrier-protein) synthase
MMIACVADNITSPLGMNTEENYAAVKVGRSMLRCHEHVMGIPEPFVASMFTAEQWSRLLAVGPYTRYGCLLIQAVSEALCHTDVDVSSPRVVFVVSTTKGNVELLGSADGRHMSGRADERLLLGKASQVVSGYFGNPNMPITVSNACVSGLAAQLVAKRMLESGSYDVVVVCGADVLSRFIIAGFLSLKAVSAQPCRPFDLERNGMNLGEAAACMVYQRIDNSSTAYWVPVRGAMRNDAWHISSPSPQGEGCYRALRSVMKATQPSALACINVHGTSTLFNDEMEAVAIDRAGLSAVPVNSLKGYYGHTMGASGLLETILTMQALDHGMVVGSRGFNELGVSRRMNISSQHRPTDKHSFVKLLSGFGGCNAAMLFQKEGQA